MADQSFLFTASGGESDFWVTMPFTRANDLYFVSASPVGLANLVAIDMPTAAGADRTTTTFRVVTSAALQASDRIEFRVYDSLSTALPHLSTFTLINDAAGNGSSTGFKILPLSPAIPVIGAYFFKYLLRVQTSNTTVGVKFGVNFTGASSSVVATMFVLGTGTTAVTGTATGVATAAQIVEGYATRSFSTSAPNLGPSLGHDTASADVLYVIDGILNAGATGNLELYHGSEVTGTTQVMARSTLILINPAVS